MARPPINTGSSALQAYMQGVANMGQVRAQMQQNTTNAINALGDTFTKWQDDFNKRKHLKWTQQMEEAKLAETNRVNDANIDIAYNQDARDEKMLSADMDYKKAAAESYRADAAAKNEATRQSREIYNYGEKNMMGDIVKATYGANKKDDTSAAAPNSNGEDKTGTPAAQPQGFFGWFANNTAIGQKLKGAAKIAQDAKQQKQAAAQATPTLAGS